MTGNVNDAMTIKLDYELPEYPEFDAQYRRAPRRESHLSEADKALAIKNALRYIHPDHHEQMAKEFAQELEEHGRIYGYRFRPAGKLYGKPIDEYKGACIEGRAIQVMIDNNLDFDVALYPYELVTYPRLLLLLPHRCWHTGFCMPQSKCQDATDSDTVL